MNVTITPKPLEGTITPPPSKSQAHRALLAAALLWMGWYGWRVDCKVDRKVRRLQSQCKSKEPRRKEREDYWAA